MNKTIEQRVRDGSTYLDMTVPGWWERINLDKLDLTSCLNCVIGQLTGDFYSNETGICISLGVDTYKLAEEMGFYFECDNEATLDREYAALTAEWKRVILARRTESAQPVPLPEKAEAR